MKEILRAFATYPQNDRRAISIFFVALLLLIFFPYLMPLWHRPPHSEAQIAAEQAKFREQLAPLQQAIWQAQAELRQNNQQARAYHSKTDVKDDRYVENPQLFPFNPNLLTLDDAMRLGLPQRTAQNWVNYTAKGGKFRQKEDIKKIYSLSEADYQRLLPFIVMNLPADKGSDKGSTPSSPALAQTQTQTAIAALSPFDPNTLTADQAQQLAIPPYVAKNLLNYVAKGGKFRQKEDLRKIYGMTDAEYQRLEPYISISVPAQANIATTTASSAPSPPLGAAKPELPATFTTSAKTARNELLTVDINTASTDKWEQLPGIGAKLADRIVKYRTALGGFYSPSQLKEVYGLPEETYNLILPKLENNTSEISKININTADYETLSKHPYIKSKGASTIIKTREKYGEFTDFKALKQFDALSEDMLEKAKPYLILK